MQGYTGLYGAIHSYTGLCKAIQGYTQLCRAIHSYTEVYTAIQSYTGLYRAIQTYTGLYTALHSYTGLNRTIRSYTGLYTAIQGSTELYTTALCYTGLYRAIHGYTELCRALHSYTGPYIAIQNYTVIHLRILTCHEKRPLFVIVWRDSHSISLLSFWGFSRVSSSLNNVSTIETSADIGASYATSYTWTLRLAETILTRLVTYLWVSGSFSFSSNSAPTASLHTLFYHYNFIGSGCVFAIVTSTQASTRVVHFVARAFTRNTENV